MQEVLACAEPVMPPKNILATILESPRLAGRRPISSIANRISFSVIFPRFIISPASMKNGIAKRGRLPMPLKIDCGITSVARGVAVDDASATRLSKPVNIRLM